MFCGIGFNGFARQGQAGNENPKIDDGNPNLKAFRQGVGEQRPPKPLCWV
jgi:hypothetical protein